MGTACRHMPAMEIVGRGQPLAGWLSRSIIAMSVGTAAKQIGLTCIGGSIVAVITDISHRRPISSSVVVSATTHFSNQDHMTATVHHAVELEANVIWPMSRALLA